MTTTTYRIAAVPPDRLAAMREAALDDGGNAIGSPRPATGSEPLRCCLRMAQPGEPIHLVAYKPFGAAGGPYAEVGPVFVHSQGCDGYSDGDAYPREFRDRVQVFRCYDGAGNIVGGEMRHASEAEPVLAELLADPGVDVVHVRNVVYGCFMFEVRRS